MEVWCYANAPQGGDVYYASGSATGRISRLLLADLAGHGTVRRTPMRRFVNRLDQAEFVKLLNRQFAKLSGKGAFAADIVCNAGHPRPFIYRAAQQKWDFLCHESKNCHAVPYNIPLGLLDISEYDHFDVELHPGERVLTYTDALMEAGGEMLGEEGVLRIFRLIGDEHPETPREIDRRTPENPAADDVTVMIFTATVRQPKVTVVDKVRAFGRLLKAFLTPDPVPLPDANLAHRWRPCICH